MSFPVHLVFKSVWSYTKLVASSQRAQYCRVLVPKFGAWNVFFPVQLLEPEWSAFSVYHRPSGAHGLPAGQWALPQFSSYTGRHMPVLPSSRSTLFWVCGILACCFWRTGNHMTCPTYSHCSSLSGSHRLHNAVGHMLSVKYLFQSHMEWRFHWDTQDCNFYWGLEWELWQMCYLKI